MNTKEKAAPGANGYGLSHSVARDFTRPALDGKSTRKGKLFRILSHLASGNRLHRFQAERIGDHCLPTTISDLQNRHGIYFERERKLVPNRFGGETSVAEYWLSGDNLARARKIVGYDMGGTI